MFPAIFFDQIHGGTADSRPKLVAGSAEGYCGHVDGKLREARMNHPKGLTVDDKGNIYIADTMNMAIRKISDGGKFYMCSIQRFHCQKINFFLPLVMSNNVKEF